MGYAAIIIGALLCLLMLPFSGAAANGAAEGLLLFADSVFPALFPFIVCSGLILRSGFAQRSDRCGRAAAVLSFWAVSSVCGTPSSAIIMNDMHERKVFSNKDASFLCSLFAQPGPVFVVFTLCGRFLGFSQLAKLFLCAQYLPTFLISVVYLVLSRNSVRKDISSAEARGSEKASFVRAFTGAIDDAARASLRVCGTLVFFKSILSVISSVGASALVPLSVRGFSFGLIEMTNGLKLLSFSASRLNIALCAFLLQFGGVCIFTQMKLTFPELSSSRYFAVKLLVSASSFLIAYILYPFIPLEAQVFADLTQSVSGLSEGAETRSLSLALSAVSVAFALAAAFVFTRTARKSRR